jgi:hypothetical protein
MCHLIDIDEILQWVGAVFIIAGHSLNAVGPAAYPFNIMTFFIGTVLFLIWSLRVKNRPQLLVNVIALSIGAPGLYRAYI